MAKITAYYGEFLVSPAPLELSLNFCSHRCSYCFANLNKPDRKADINTIISQITKCRTQINFEAQLLSRGYAVLLSNRVDPFAETNYRLSLPIIELLQNNGNPVIFQTKGGRGVNEAIDMISYKTTWYITISYWNDDTRKHIEAGAPSIQSRFDLIEKLISKGHHVIVGINPLIEKWTPRDDLDKLLDHLHRLGVRDIWTESLHFSHEQLRVMPDIDRVKYDDDLVKLTTARKSNTLTDYICYAVEVAKSKGFNVYSTTMQSFDPIFARTHELLGNAVFKTWSDYFAYLKKENPDADYAGFGFDDMHEYFANPALEIKSTQHRGYMMVNNRAYVRQKNVYVPDTLKEIMRFNFDNHTYANSINKLSVLDGHDDIYLCEL